LGSVNQTKLIWRIKQFRLLGIIALIVTSISTVCNLISSASNVCLNSNVHTFYFFKLGDFVLIETVTG